MGLLDFGRTVLTSLKADASQGIAEANKLKKVNREMGQAQLDQAKAEDERAKKAEANLKKIAVGVGVAIVAYKAWKSATDAYVKSAGMADEKAKKIVAANKAMEKAFGDVKVAIGGMLADLTPLIQAFAALVSVIAMAVQGLRDFIAEGVNLPEVQGGIKTVMRGFGKAFNVAGSTLPLKEAEAAMRADIDARFAARNALFEAAKRRALQDRVFAAGAFGMGTGLAGMPKAVHADTVVLAAAKVIFSDRADGLSGPAAREADMRAQLGGAPFGGAGFEGLQSRLSGGRFRAFDGLPGFAASGGSFQTLGGFVSQFGGDAGLQALAGLDKQLNPAREALETMAPAFDAMAQAGAAAFQALITGSEGFATAFRRAMGQILLAEGSLMFGKGISEGVMALVSLAWGDPGDALLHGKASAAAFAAAAVEGTLAAALGGGGGGGGRGNSASIPVSSGGAVPGSGGSTTNIFMVPTDDPRQDSARMWERMQRAERERGGPGPVRDD